MKKTYYIRGFFLIIVILTLLLLINPFSSANYVEDNIVLLNLDDRPANEYIPQNIANAGAMSVTSIPEDLMERISPRDKNFDPSLIDEMGDFLVGNKKVEKADAFVISADMLFFGGLVSSRSVDLDFEMDAKERLKRGSNVLKNINKKYPETPVYVYSSIQRLAPTLAGDVGEEEYDDLRYFAIFYDRVHNENQEDYVSSLERIQDRIPENILGGYLKSREINQEVNLKLLELLAENYIDYMVISQDDAADYGLHRKEQKELEEKINALGLGDKIEIFPGTDEVDGVLISRYLNKAYEREPAFYPVYPDVPEIFVEELDPDYYDPDKWMPLLENIPLSENLEAHINALGGKLVDDREKADVLMYINTLNCGCGEESEDLVRRLIVEGEIDEDRESDIREQLTRSIEEFAGEVALSVNAGQYTAVSDVGKLNGSCDTFVKSLLEKVELLDLLSYSGWNTAGNSLGQSLAQSNNRHFFLEASAQMIGTETTYQLNNQAKLMGTKAQANLIFHRFSKDYVYAGEVRSKAIDYIDTWRGNKYELKDNYERVFDYLDVILRDEVTNFYLEHFSGKRLLSKAASCNCCEGFGIATCKDDRDDTGYYVIRGLSGLEIDMPWQRLFEVSIITEFSVEFEG